MNLRVNFVPRVLDEQTDIAVVIDVLRATSTITTALHLGAKKVIPVESVEEALECRKRDREVLLGGERGSMKIEGFDLANSPVALCKKMIFGKELVMTTTNGTNAALLSKRAGRLVAASFLNLERINGFLESEGGRIELQCAGSSGRVSLEDVLLAGAIVSGLGMGCTDDGCTLASLLYESAKSDLESFFIENGFHARRLLSLGFGDDISFCARINMYNLLPLWRDGGFVRG
ncbi:MULTISPECIES: 2-phosphosulfolactate phosphatase [unclassified Mesotoga]|jgi:2-phosphosulfolactate phosphatase|nr:2-phosphosulfolactate phosphatase [Mesotoga sp. B105.6.4]PNS41984.1 phosphosulfolactate phosphohydrolase [Mesotoga sp. B105.6.4]